MKLKRTFTLLLALALCMSLAACGKTSADKGSGNATDVSLLRELINMLLVRLLEQIAWSASLMKLNGLL